MRPVLPLEIILPVGLLLVAILAGYIEARLGVSRVLPHETALAVFVVSTVVFTVVLTGERFAAQEPEAWIAAYLCTLPVVAILSVLIHVLPFYLTYQSLKK